MRIRVLPRDALDIDELADEELRVDSADGEHHFGPIEMFIASVGLCSAATLEAYGAAIGIDARDLRLGIRWGFAESPNRIAWLKVDIAWPSLPMTRSDAAKRAAELCTLHHTLAASVAITTRVVANAKSRTAHRREGHEVQ